MYEEDDEDWNVNLENGHYSSGHQSEASENDNIEAEADEQNAGPASEFDTNLPTTHNYLGKMENISGYTLFDDGQVIEMLAMYTNTMVFPGFTLPLLIRAYDAENIYQDFKNGYTFVLTCLNHNSNSLFEYGVVMEVFERSRTRGAITLKAKGRQRCRILPGQIFSVSSRVMCRMKVQILPEPLLKSMISNTQLLTLKHHRKLKKDYNTLEQSYRKYHLAQFTFPSWVYDLFEVDYYVKQVMEGLIKYYSKDNIPRDPTVLSYWFVQNFQLTLMERLKILACNTTLERLRRELVYLNLERQICCGSCGAEITTQDKVFAMSKDGVQSNYVNPGGVVYETVTVTCAKNYELDGIASKQYSWFPGYAWTIMKCCLCNNHLGWKFTSQNLNPGMFYGLALSSLKIKITNNTPSA